MVKWNWKSLSPVWLFSTPWTIQSVEFSRLEFWSESHSFLQGLSTSKVSNPSLPHCRFGKVNEKRFQRGERAHAKTQREESVVGLWIKQKSRAAPGSCGGHWLLISNWMQFSAMKERKRERKEGREEGRKERRKEEKVLWFLTSSMLPPNFKTCFHMYLIPYWEGSIVLCSPGNAP